MIRTEGNVIHADFGKREPSLAVQVTNDILYLDDKIMLFRCSLGLNGTVYTTHFLAHRAGERIEVIPVNV